jgi:hypothetical protein
MTYTVDTHMTRLSTIAENWKHLVVIIRFNNRSNLKQSGLVLVIGTHKVKTAGRCWFSIAAGVVDS